MFQLKRVYINYLFTSMQKQFVTGLKLKNSLSNQLETFVPMDSNLVKWYTCGPTVYSNSHMGHARNYLCNDMIKRVMRDHFGYNIQYCMNITDVDDKIINNSNAQGIEYFEFARKWEKDYFEDMDSLGLQVPDYITRVTEYVPEIVAFIEKIIANGYAYASNGSVYFNIQAYKEKFQYGKLKRIKQAETEEQEKNQKGEKKNKQDFALWKASKPNEPKWPSPWGEGRPGWHIECSAMAVSILGQKMDIHSGGVDLIFPHHENQLAQSEAYNNEPKWTNYFLHVGHLHIKGLKMSKSLKNFITIKEMLKHSSARVIKLYFFMHRYDMPLSYDPETSLEESGQKDKRYKNFFSSLRASIRDQKLSAPQKPSAQDIEFDNTIELTRVKIHEAFCDNINTPQVIAQVDELIKKVNIYLESKTVKVPLLYKAYNILIHPFNAMGINYQASEEKTNWIVDSMLNSIAKFRDEIRNNSKSDFKKILDICDNFRDYAMVDLGVRLEDKKMGEPSVWKFEAKEILVKERQDKIEATRKKEEEKRQKQEEKLKKMRVNPTEMFRQDAKYTQFDENGIPTFEKTKQKVKQGDKTVQKQGQKAVNEKLKAKLTKEWTAQKEQYEKYLQIEKEKKQ